MINQTEYEFNLPIGYVDEEGLIHKKGVMRLAIAADEILPLQDSRVQQNPAYFTILLLSRVIIKLGDLPSITPNIIEAFLISDFSYLKDFYNTINSKNVTQNNKGNSFLLAKCPNCGKEFETEHGVRALYAYF